MKRKLTLLLYFAIPLFCMAQNPLTREYSYDAVGNRTSRVVINLPPPPMSPPPPPEDPILTEIAPEDGEELATLVSLTSSGLEETTPKDYTEYFVEKVGQIEMKIYPNPTTEKITFEILGFVETRLIASLQLYSLTGQLLQMPSVQSATTAISLAGLPSGTYILKVQMNDRIEDWKIIKH